MVFDRSLRVAAVPTLRGAGVASLNVFVEFYRAERARLEGGGCPVFRRGTLLRRTTPKGGGRSMFRVGGLFRKPRGVEPLLVF